MKYALYSPPFGAFSDPRVMVELAQEAEGAGWDGYFLWDHILFGSPVSAPMGDPWVTLAAMAMVTSRIRLGTMVTPLARRRPAKLAREAITLDYLSGGRVVLGLGIGEDRFGREFSALGEPTDDRVHAEMLDEGLEILAGLWSGKAFSYHGKHYHVENATFLPRPLQQPRIPIWLAGNWPHQKPFRRAAHWDGIVPQAVQGALKPADYREIAAYIQQFRASDEPFDMTRTALFPSEDPGKAAEVIAAYEEAGVTWWLLPLEDDMGPIEELHARVRKGPPR